MRHRDRASGVGGVKRSPERDVADVAAGDVQARKLLVVETLPRSPGREDASPDLRPLLGVRERELDDEAKAPQEGRIERALLVRRQDREPAIRLHSLEEVAYLDVRVAVVAVLDLAALPEEGVRLVEEEDRAPLLGRVEHAAEVLLRLADVLADDRAQIDPVEVEAELGGEHLGGHRLSRSARPGEERADPEAAG